jgi:hypothetical protein
MSRLVRYLTWDYDATYFCSLDGSRWRAVERALLPLEQLLRRAVCWRRGHRFGDPAWTWKTWCSRCGRGRID